MDNPTQVQVVNLLPTAKPCPPFSLRKIPSHTIFIYRSQIQRHSSNEPFLGPIGRQPWWRKDLQHCWLLLRRIYAICFICSNVAQLKFQPLRTNSIILQLIHRLHHRRFCNAILKHLITKVHQRFRSTPPAPSAVSMGADPPTSPRRANSSAGKGSGEGSTPSPGGNDAWRRQQIALLTGGQDILKI